jgi:hypothetical protein
VVSCWLPGRPNLSTRPTAQRKRDPDRQLAIGAFWEVESPFTPRKRDDHRLVHRRFLNSEKENEIPSLWYNMLVPSHSALDAGSYLDQPWQGCDLGTAARSEELSIIDEIRCVAHE